MWLRHDLLALKMEEGGHVPKKKKHVQSLVSKEGKKTHSILRTFRAMQLCWHLDFGLMRPMSNLQNYKIILYGFEPLSLWQFVTTTIENEHNFI